MKRIMVATDGSADAWAAVKEGTELALDVGAEVTFVTVRHAVPLLGDPLYQQRVTAQLERARKALDRARLHAELHGVTCDSEILEGDPATCIAEAARVREADLVVVGSRGHGSLASALIGSVSRGLVERSTVPVMVVRRQVRQRSAA